MPSSASASAPTSASPALTRAKWTRPKSTKPAVKTRSHWESYTTASSKRASLRKTSPPLPPASLYESRSAANAATWQRQRVRRPRFDRRHVVHLRQRAPQRVPRAVRHALGGLAPSPGLETRLRGRGVAFGELASGALLARAPHGPRRRGVDRRPRFRLRTRSRPRGEHGIRAVLHWISSSRLSSRRSDARPPPTPPPPGRARRVSTATARHRWVARAREGARGGGADGAVNMSTAAV